MYTVASPDPNLRGEGQLPNPNECNSTLTSGTKNILGHRLRSGSPVTNLPGESPETAVRILPDAHFDMNIFCSVLFVSFLILL